MAGLDFVGPGDSTLLHGMPVASQRRHVSAIHVAVIYGYMIGAERSFLMIKMIQSCLNKAVTALRIEIPPSSVEATFASCSQLFLVRNTHQSGVSPTFAYCGNSRG